MVLNDLYNTVESQGRGEYAADGVGFFRNEFLSLIKLLSCEELREFRVEHVPEILPLGLESPGQVARTAQVRLAGDTPVAVFRFLRENLLPLLRNEDGTRNGKQAVIDITGAKKSMVSGAYLFAAYADVPVSYVDFDLYSADRGRPYGYTCKIGELESPSREFRLEEWARARELYGQYAFRSVRDLLHEVLIPAMKERFYDTGERCDLRLKNVSDVNAKDKMIDEFKMEFGSKKKKRAVLIVCVISDPKIWTIAGFSDVGEFRTVVIDNSRYELWEELKKQPINESRIVELALSSLGLTPGERLFDSLDIKAAKRLRSMMTLYQRWDEGDYSGTFRSWMRIQAVWPRDHKPCPEPPTAVVDLGKESRWPSARTTDPLITQIEALESWLYKQPASLLIYAYDELDKIRRHVNLSENYRSALLRAAGLSEMLIKARLLHLWYENELELEQDGQWKLLRLFPATEEAKWIKVFVSKSMKSTQEICDFLQGSNSSMPINRWKLRPVPNARKLQVFWQASGISPKHLAKVRNKAIHFYVPVSRDLAEKALRHVERNLFELMCNWLPMQGIITTEAPSWHKLCDACGIKFLPPYKGNS